MHLSLKDVSVTLGTKNMDDHKNYNQACVINYEFPV